MKVPEHKIKRGLWARSSFYCKPLEHSGSTCASSALMVVFLAMTGGKQVTAEAPVPRKGSKTNMAKGDKDDDQLLS